MASDQTPTSLRALGLERKPVTQNASDDHPKETVEVDEVVKLPLLSPSSVFDVPLSYRSRESNADLTLLAGCNTQTGSHDRADADVDVDANKNSAGTIPYIDGDDQEIVLPAGETDGQEFAHGTRSNVEKGKNSLPALSSSSALNNFSRNAVAFGAVSADLLEPPNESASEKLEFPVEQNLRQRVPPSTTFYNSGFVGLPEPVDCSQKQQSDSQQRGRRRDSGHQDLSPKEHNEELRSDANTDMEKRNGDQAAGRSGKMVRRKQREDKSVKRSEDVDGFRGDQNVEDLVAYIEGTEAAKKTREEHGGKRTKKKSGASGDQGNTTQKKERASNPVDFDDDSGSPTPPASVEQENSSILDNATSDISVDRAADTKLSGNRDILQLEGDAASAERLQMETIKALRGDLSPSTTSNAANEKENFVTVFSRKPKQQRSGVRIFTASKGKGKRAATPPPASRKEDPSTLPKSGRQRRNSYDYSFVGCVTNTITAFASAKETLSSASTYSCQLKACTGNTSDVTTFASQTLLDNADSEFANVSFSSVDGEAAAVKMSYANVAAAVCLSRSNQEYGKMKENQSKPNSPRGSAQRNIPKTSVTKETSASTVDVKNPLDFPSLSSASNVVDATGSCNVAEIEKRPAKGSEVVSLPPAKADAGKRFEGMDFVYVSPEESGSDQAAAAKIGAASYSEAAELSSGLVGSGKEVLQLLFDSCKSSDLAGASEQRADVAASSWSVNGSNGNSGPAVQFLGMPQLDTVCDVSFLVGETEDDRHINAVMMRSLSVGARPTKDDSIDTSAVSVKSESDANKCGNGDAFAGKPLGVGRVFNQEKSFAYTSMAEFAKQAWDDFMSGGNVAFYDPRED